jgi:hypothetical protein
MLLINVDTTRGGIVDRWWIDERVPANPEEPHMWVAIVVTDTAGDADEHDPRAVFSSSDAAHRWCVARPLQWPEYSYLIAALPLDPAVDKTSQEARLTP